MEALNARGERGVRASGAASARARTLQLPWPFFMMEYLFDTTRAVVNLVFSGALERYPAHPLRPGARRRA